MLSVQTDGQQRRCILRTQHGCHQQPHEASVKCMGPQFPSACILQALSDIQFKNRISYMKKSLGNELEVISKVTKSFKMF